MKYRFLASKEIEKLFDNSNLSVSDIIEVLYLIKIKLEKKNEPKDITNKMFYESIESVSEDILSDNIIEDDKEWKETVYKIFKK